MFLNKGSEVFDWLFFFVNRGYPRAIFIFLYLYCISEWGYKIELAIYYRFEFTILFYNRRCTNMYTIPKENSTHKIIILDCPNGSLCNENHFVICLCSFLWTFAWTCVLVQILLSLMTRTNSTGSLRARGWWVFGWV